MIVSQESRAERQSSCGESECCEHTEGMDFDLSRLDVWQQPCSCREYTLRSHRCLDVHRARRHSEESVDIITRGCPARPILRRPRSRPKTSWTLASLSLLPAKTTRPFFRSGLLLAGFSISSTLAASSPLLIARYVALSSPLPSYLLPCPSSSLQLHNDAFLPKLWSATHRPRFLDGSFSFVLPLALGPSRPIPIARTLLFLVAFYLLSSSSPLTQSPFQQVPWSLGESGCFPSRAPFT